MGKTLLGTPFSLVITCTSLVSIARFEGSQQHLICSTVFPIHKPHPLLLQTCHSSQTTQTNSKPLMSSQLANALGKIVKKASHPNALLYQVQLERAQKKYLAEGKQLGDGLEGVVALGPPKGERAQVQDKAEMKSGEGAMEGKDEGRKEDGVGSGGGEIDGAEVGSESVQ